MCRYSAALPYAPSTMYWLPSLFFASGRRHTRWPRDWSSDVCSSDLASVRHGEDAGGNDGQQAKAATRAAGQKCRDAARSEERRVGKECRRRWGAEHEKKKEGEEIKMIRIRK